MSKQLRFELDFGGGFINKSVLEIFKEMYYHELNIKEMINSRIGVPICAISVVVTIIIYMISNISLPQNNAINYVFYILLGTCCITSIISLFYLTYIVIKGFSYKYIPRPSQIDDYVRALELNYYNFNSKKILPYTKDQYVNKKLDRLLYDEYKNAIENNLFNNELKLKYLRKINIFITLALITGFFAGLVFYCVNQQKEDKPQKVEVVNINK